MAINKLNVLAIILGLLLAGCEGAEDRLQEHFARGKSLFESENYEKARVEFKNVLQIDPNHVETLFMLGQVMENLQDFRSAAQTYMRVVSLDAAHIGARIKLGKMYLIGNVDEKALELAEQGLVLEPDNPDLLVLRGGVRAKNKEFNLAQADGLAALAKDDAHLDAIGLLSLVYRQKQDYDKAIAILKQGIQKHPDYSPLRVSLASLYAEQGKSEDAIAMFKEVNSLEPDNLGYHVRLAALYSNLKKFDEAEQVMRNATTSLKDNDQAKIELIRFLYARHGVEQAERELAQFIEHKPASTELRFTLANLYISAKQEGKVAHVYRDIIARNDNKPDTLKAKNKLAQLLLAQEKQQEAETLISEVLSDNPDDNDAHMLRGKVRLARADVDGAIADFRTVLNDQPASIETLRLLALAHLSKDEVELAKDHLKKAVEIDDNNIPLALEYARLTLRLDDFKTTEEYINKVLAKAPKHREALEGLFNVRSKQSRWNDALKTAQQIKEYYPDLAMGYYLAGLANYGMEKFNASIKELEKALEISPKAFVALSVLTRVHIAKQQPGVARLKLEQSLDTIEQTDKAKIYNLIGETWLVEKKYKDAAVAFNKAITLNPEQVISYRNLASTYMAQNDVTGAINVYEQGIDKTSGDPALVFQLASLYAGQGKYDEAIAQYEAMLSEDQKSDMASNNMAMLIATYKPDQVSLEKASQLVQHLKSSENPSYLDTIGWVAYKRGKYNDAVPVLERAAEKSPDAPLIRYHLGMAYHNAGQKELARHNLEKALKTNARFEGIDEAKATFALLAGN